MGTSDDAYWLDRAEKAKEEGFVRLSEESLSAVLKEMLKLPNHGVLESNSIYGMRWSEGHDGRHDIKYTDFKYSEIHTKLLTNPK